MRPEDITHAWFLPTNNERVLSPFCSWTLIDIPQTGTVCVEQLSIKYLLCIFFIQFDPPSIIIGASFLGLFEALHSFFQQSANFSINLRSLLGCPGLLLLEEIFIARTLQDRSDIVLEIRIVVFGEFIV